MSDSTPDITTASTRHSFRACVNSLFHRPGKMGDFVRGFVITAPVNFGFFGPILAAAFGVCDVPREMVVGYGAVVMLQVGTRADRESGPTALVGMFAGIACGAVCTHLMFPPNAPVAAPQNSHPASVSMSAVPALPRTYTGKNGVIVKLPRLVAG